MRNLTRFGGLVALATITLLLAGCATRGTVATRKQERYAAYSALSPEMRTIVDQGRITIGMNLDAVYIAWGRPDRISEGETAEARTTTWTYYGSYLQDVNVVGGRRSYFASYVVDYIRAQTIFTNGAVKEWHEYPAPGF